MVADSTGPGVASKVLFSTNHKKRQIFKDGVEVGGKGPAARRECILGGQFAALSSEVRLASLPGSHPQDKVPKSLLRWQDLAMSCNRYYEPRLYKELALLDGRGFCDPAWSSQLNALLQALGPALKTGDCFLLRVGRHSGAENVTLDGVRDIRIMQARGMPPRSADAATTLWLAAEHENTTGYSSSGRIPARRMPCASGACTNPARTWRRSKPGSTRRAKRRLRRPALKPRVWPSVSRQSVCAWKQRRGKPRPMRSARRTNAKSVPWLRL
jgi:CRISPR-associated protein Csm5